MRNNFYEQKYKLKTLRSNQFSDDTAEKEQHLESNDVEPTQRIYINESLTKENRELLKLAIGKKQRSLSTNTKVTQ